MAEDTPRCTPGLAWLVDSFRRKSCSGLKSCPEAVAPLLDMLRRNKVEGRLFERLPLIYALATLRFSLRGYDPYISVMDECFAELKGPMTDNPKAASISCRAMWLYSSEE